MTLTQQRTYYRQQHIRRMSLYNHCLVAAKRALRLQMRPVLTAVRAGQSIDVAVHAIRTEPIEQGLLSIYSKVVPVFALMAYKQLQQKADDGSWQEKKGFFDSLLESQWIARARYYVNTVGSERIRKIAETTRNKVRQFLTDAIKEGWSVNRTATELTSYAQALNKSRAIVVARTELISASNFGALQGAKATKLKLDKFWIATGDTRTRDTHRHVNGQTVDIDAPFKVGGYLMSHPGDGSSGAPAKELVLCRCAMGFKPKAAPQ